MDWDLLTKSKCDEKVSFVRQISTENWITKYLEYYGQRFAEYDLSNQAEKQGSCLIKT